MKKSLDKKVKFYEKSHTYKLGKKQLKSVTSLIHTLFNEFDAKKISVFSARKATRERGYLVTPAAIRKEWKMTNLIAVSKGNLVHAEMEKWLLEKDEALLPVYHVASQHGVKWVNEYLKGLINPRVIPEMILYNEGYGLAGQSDLVVFHEIDGEEVVDIVDWKTNREIVLKSKYYKKGTKESTKELSDCNFVHYSIQLSIYSYFLELQGHKINNLILPHLTIEGATVYPVEYLKDKVIEILNDYMEDKNERSNNKE